MNKDEILDYVSNYNSTIIGVAMFSGDIFDEYELKREIKQSKFALYDKDSSILELEDCAKYTLYKLCELN